MNTTPEAFTHCIVAVRAQWGRVTPFRLGMYVGEQGLQLPNPYPNTPGRGHQLYVDGVHAGCDRALKQRLRE